MIAIEKLVAVQEHDLRIRDVDKELNDIPVRKQQELSRLDEHKKAEAEAETALKAKQQDVKKFEGEIQELKGRIVTLRQQQGSLKTNKEFKAMEDEVKGVQDQISAVEDRELGLMEAIEAAAADVAEKKRLLADEDALVQTDTKVLDARAAELEAKIKQMKAERDKAAEGIPVDVLHVYDRVFSRRDRALVTLEDGICGGCHMKLPPAVAHEARKRVEMVVCSYCGRLLY